MPFAFFSGRIKENGVMKKRLAGYRDALAEYELPFREELVFEGNIDYKDGIASAQRLMDAGLPATAVVAAADILAIERQKLSMSAVSRYRTRSPLWGLTIWRLRST